MGGVPVTFCPCGRRWREAPDEGRRRSAPWSSNVGNCGKRERASRRASSLPFSGTGEGRVVRRFGELGFLLGEGPVEPEGQRFDVGCLDRRAAPDAQAGRSVAIAADVEGDLLLLQRAGERLGERRCPSAGKAATSLSTTLRQTLVLERVAERGRGSRPTASWPPSRRSPWRWRRRARTGPSARRRSWPHKRVDVVLDAQHRGVLIVSPSKIPSISCRPWSCGRLGQRPGRLVGLEPLDRARAEDDHAVRRLAASAFCQEKVVTSSFGQSRSCANAARSRRRSSSPCDRRRSISRRGRARPRSCRSSEDDVVIEIDLSEIGQLAVGRLQRARVGELELLDDVGDPAVAEAFPRSTSTAARR